MLKDWTIDSEFVDPERVLLVGGFNGDGQPIDPSGGFRRPGHTLRTVIHLPAGYDGERRFPVLYLLHGQGGYADVWLGDGCSGAQCVDFEPFFRRLPAVVVMVEGGEFGFFSNWWKGGRGTDRVSGWERYHLEEVVSAVERNLKIRHGRRWRAIFGVSMGGHGAIRYASQYPEYFGTAGSISGLLDSQDPLMPGVCAGSLALNVAGHGARAIANETKSCEDLWGDMLLQEFYWRGHNPMHLTRNLLDTRVYVSHGAAASEPPPADQEHFLAMNSRRWVEAARRDGVEVRYRPRGGGHTGSAWLDDLQDAVDRWGIFEPVEDRPRQWSFTTVSQQGAMWGLRYRFDEPLEAVATFERDEDVLSGSGKGTVTIEAETGKSFTVELPFRISLLPSGQRG